MSTEHHPNVVRELAYWLWETRGRRDGHAEEDWLEAEARVVSSNLVASPQDLSRAVDESSKQSFPASDPPSSHTPDRPVANADAKWATAKANPRSRNAKNGGPTDPRAQPEMPKVGSRDAPGG